MVEELPVLDQNDYPQLPEGFPEDSALLVFDSPMKNAEKEWVLGVVATYAIRAGQWEPVSATKFIEVMGDLHQGAAMSMFGQNTVNASWHLAEEGLLSIVTFEETDYLIPSAEFA